MPEPAHKMDALKWGYSLANVSELLLPCLDAAEVGSVLEIGSFQGDLTSVLLDWADGRGASVATVEPLPPEQLLELKRERPELNLIEDTGHGAVAGLESLPDAIIIDGDHNYFTLSQELELIAERYEGDLPLLMFHDVGWPHERRDTYYAPDRIPADQRQPLGHQVTLAPGNPGLNDGGLPYEWAAEREGGERNGVLTAIEDFMEKVAGLRLAVIPVFFGFGVLWPERAGYSGAVAGILDPWDRNPLMERVEANRVAHLVQSHVNAKQIWDRDARVEKQQQEIVARDERIAALEQRIAARDQLLRDMLESSAFGAAERLSRIRQRGEPIFSRERIRETLDD